MKHPTGIVITLLAMFLLSQLIGVFVLKNYIDTEETEKTGVLTYKELPSGIERPELNPKYSFIFITTAILAGTAILLLIIKFKKILLWKLWYMASTFATLGIAWAAFMPARIAWAIAFAAAAIKVFKSNFIIHNLTELFIYSGLAAIFVPVMNILSATILLLIISAYDMFAVWKSGHMVAIAKFQMHSNIFAGIAIPKTGTKTQQRGRTTPDRQKKTAESSLAIVGGGDMGFPILFAGTVMASYGFQKASIIPVFATLGLLALFLISKKGKFYPAMPFISAGCFVGYGIVLLAGVI